MLETDNLYGMVSTSKSGQAYSSAHEQANTEIGIDARGDHVYISMIERRPRTNRTTGASIVLSREEWNEFKAAIVAAGGEI